MSQPGEMRIPVHNADPASAWIGDDGVWHATLPDLEADLAKKFPADYPGPWPWIAAFYEALPHYNGIVVVEPEGEPVDPQLVY